MSDVKREWKPIECMGTGTVFLQLDGPLNRLGMIIRYDSGDRMGRSSVAQYEDGSIYKFFSNGAKRPQGLVLDRIELGTHPLRSLLLWREQYDTEI